MIRNNRGNGGIQKLSRLRFVYAGNYVMVLRRKDITATMDVKEASRNILHLYITLYFLAVHFLSCTMYNLSAV